VLLREKWSSREKKLAERGKGDRRFGGEHQKEFSGNFCLLAVPGELPVKSNRSDAGEE